MITDKMTIGEVADLPEFSNFCRFLMNCRLKTWDKIKKMSLADAGMPYKDNHILEGLQNMEQHIKNGIKVDYSFWTPKEIEEEPDRIDTKLFYFPGVEEAPFVLIFSGGGYQSVCSIFEGIPAAAKLNKEGYNVFVLSYRVRQKKLFPKPIEDAARALKFILDNSDMFQTSKKYAVMGFSAGGHLAAECGTTNIGFLAKGLPAPSAILLCYAVIDPRLIYASKSKSSEKFSDSVRDIDGSFDEYVVTLHMDNTFPPTCIWQCEDDDVCGIEHYEVMCKALEELKIPHEGFTYLEGGHGLVNYHSDESELWIYRMISFLKKIIPA